MKDEHQNKYQELYDHLGLDPKEFEDLDAAGRREKVKQALVMEFCKDTCPECHAGCC